jgi:Carboxypeptidase regulatory-like domain/TonB dependent receptor
MAVARSRFIVCLSLVLLSCIASLHAIAQGITATIVGTVADQQGALIPGARVKVTNVGTGFSESTASDGQAEFHLGNLPVGTYDIEVSAPDFQNSIQHNIVLTVDQTRNIAVVLAIGTQVQTITVTNAPALVNTNTSEVGRTVEPDEIVGLPLVNRNVNTEISLTAGVQSNSASATNSGSVNFVNGIAATDVVVNGSIDAGVPSVSYYLDGGVNMTEFRDYGNQLPDPDAIDEFRVETNNFSAAYGRMSGAVVTVLTHSGTDHFHGSLYEFVRNTDLNATPWGSTLNAPYHRNQFGGTIGGPIKRDDSFFFFSYGALRQSVGTFLSGGVLPTAAERQGNFSAASVLPINPSTGQPYDFNGVPGWIPPSALDPTAQNLLKDIPLPNGPNNTWTGYFTGPTTDNEFLAKLNQKIFSKDQLSASYFGIITTSNVYGGGNLPWDTEITHDHQQNINISDIHVFNQNLSNQAWLTVTRALGSRLNTPQTSIADFGSNYTDQGPPALPEITVSGYFTLGEQFAGPKAGDDFYSVRDMVTSTKGKHNLQYGVEISLDKDAIVADEESWGSFTFAASAPNSTQNALADFVTGTVNNLTEETPYTTLETSWYYGFFLQDNYRINPHLTLNLGLRYDLTTPWVDSRNQEQTFVPAVQSVAVPAAPLGLLYPGDKGVTRGIVDMRKHHVSPRLGFAWDPFGDGKTAIRAGAGVFYGSPTGDEWNQGATGQPFAVDQTYSSIASLTNPYGNPASFPNGDPFPYTFNPSNAHFLPAAGVSAIDENYQWPLTYQLNVSVERQLPGNVSITGAYVGTLSHDIPFEGDVNYPAYAPGASSIQSSINSRRPNDPGTLGQVELLKSSQTASYHSLQISATKQMSHNLMLNGFYVFSKSFYSADPAAVGANTVAQDFDDLREERGPSDFDQRNMASISGMWNVSYYSGKNRILKQVTDGWQVAPILTFNSGLPINLLTGADNNDDGNLSDRPNLVPGKNAFLDPHRSRTAAAAKWFNTAAFVPNFPGTGIGIGGADGSTPRDYLRAPGYRDIDIGIYRNFQIKEAMKLQLRGEATNAFNFVNLGIPTATLSSPIDGTITSAIANSNRQIQLGVRLTF